MHKHGTFLARFALASAWLLAMGAWAVGCGKPGNIAHNYTSSFVTVTAVNNNEPFQSDVLTKGYGSDDVVAVKIKSVFRAPDDDPTAPDGPTLFDTITFRSYHVSHVRSDGGQNPAAFTAGISLQLLPDTEAEIKIVLVRGFDKHRPPLQQLRDTGEIFTTSVITFYGYDGNGNEIAVTGSLPVSYANFPDT